MKDGPLLEAFNNIPDGVIRQELTSYFVRDGQLVKQTVERTCSPEGDYNDNTLVVGLAQT